MGEKKELSDLTHLIAIRVNHRLKAWPAEQREDVQQDAVLRLLRAMQKHGDQIERIEAYCQRLVDNVINDALRSYSSRRKLVLLDSEIVDDNDPADNAVVKELAEGLKLSPKQQQLMTLRTTLGSTEAVATYLGIPLQTAHERVSRLRRSVKAQLRPAA